jgi:hypothetical protein
VLTVADLLSRNAPVPVKDDEPETGGISVGALLRREGRAPRAADLPLQPRPHQERADEEVGAGRRTLVRRGAIAAGTLVAAGSVFGAAMLTDVTPTANQAPGAGGAEDDGSYPGQGLLDPDAPVVTPPDSVVIDQAASTDPLDPGTPAPSDWLPVAFPGAQNGTDGGDPGSADPSGSSGDGDAPAAATTGPDDDADSTTDSGSSANNSGSTNSSGGSGGGSEDGGSSSAGGGSSSGSGESSGGSGGDDDGGDDGGLVSDVGDTVDGVVGTVSGVLGLSGGDDDRNSESEENDGGDRDENSRSMRTSSADDEDSSAPQDEDDSESRNDAKSSDDSGDDEGRDDDGGDKGDSDEDDGGVVGSLLGTVGGLLG